MSAHAAFAVDLTNQVELYAHQADEPVPPASTTKIVTALVVARTVDPEEVVTIQPTDLVDNTVYSHMGLQAGDIVTVRDLLAGLLLPSGGDAALALARYVGERLAGEAATEPRHRFVEEMNRLAVELGMRHTQFTNADGRDEPGHVSTARDLAIAAAELFEYQLLERLVAQRQLTVAVGGPNAREITLWNTNELLVDAAVHGVKTGTTGEAGQCLVAAVWRDDARVLTVVLGSVDRYGDARALLAYLDGAFEWVRIGRGGELADLHAELEQRSLVMSMVRTVILSEDQANALTYDLRLSGSSPRSRWDAVGEVRFYTGRESLLRLPVYAREQPAPT